MSETTTTTKDDYALKGAGAADGFPAPELPYRPARPKNYTPRIGLIGCGGITRWHLQAYRNAGLEVVLLCDLSNDRACERQSEFYPEAEICTDYRDALQRRDIEVFDIATHPEHRGPIIEMALEAGKHVLSQKPFVTNLDEGERLADLADRKGVRLAVNQNGRWSPHHAYLREAVRAGLIGDLLSAHIAIHWNHTWIAGSPFEKIDDVILYDFSIHWFDFLCTLLGDREINRVFATRNRARGQTIAPPMLAQTLVDFDGGQASLVFDAHLHYGPHDSTYLGGSKGTLRSVGPHLGEQTVTLFTAEGTASPNLEGTWFPDGFQGTMGELLCAIEENREPANSARNNLKSLALCFAAIESAHTGKVTVPGEVRKLPG